LFYKNYIFVIIGFFFLSIEAKGSIKDYVYRNFEVPSFSNYGTTGLIQNPTARFHQEGTLGFSWSHYDPYLRGSILAYPFNWFEASFQYTDINNRLYSRVKAFSGSQSLKDKSFDAKIRLKQESALLPQIAIGFRDLGGTGLFSAEYLVMNKQIGSSFDLSVGLGWGNLNGNKIKNPLVSINDSFNYRDAALGLGGKVNFRDFFSGDAGYFGGIEYVIPNLRGARIKIEYDGTSYQSESGTPLSQDSKINFGIVFPLTKNFQTKLFFSRGNTMNFGFSYAIGLGPKNPLGRNKIKKVKLRDSDIIKQVTSRSVSNLNRASLLYLRREGLSLQKASINDNEYHLVIAQSSYRSTAEAVGRAVNIIDQISPDYIEHIKISEVNTGLGMYSAKVPRDVYKRYKVTKSSEIIEKYIDTEGFIYNENDYQFNPKAVYPAYFNSMGPELLSQIGGPDGFFFGDLKWNFDSEIIFSRNLTLISSFAYGIVDNMDELKLPSDSILPHVRTDIVDYLKESRGFSIKRMQLNYYNQITPSLYYKFAAGIFESMFSGFGGEFLYRPFNKNFGVGIEAWRAYQRDYDQLFGTRDYNTNTGHISLYYQEPRSNILFKFKGGRYLAEDSGITLDFSRIFRSGLRIGAFFSLTDISEEEFGEGSFDKGFYFWIPVEVFSNRNMKRTFGWGLRPLTRDGAQSIIYAHPLWSVTDPASDHRFRRRIDDFYD
jgi:hypothetical protein